jgi:hypothetical protein
MISPFGFIFLKVMAEAKAGPGYSKPWDCSYGLCRFTGRYYSINALLSVHSDQCVALILAVMVFANRSGTFVGFIKYTGFEGHDA